MSDIKVGSKVKIIHGTRGSIGELVTVTEIETYGYIVTDANGRDYYKDAETIQFYQKTPAEELGYKLGDKFLVLKGMAEGEIFTFCEDDGTVCPYFKTATGRTVAKHLKDVETYVEPVKTPAQLAGLIIGEKYIITGTYFISFSIGTVVTFSEDDKSTSPRFSGINIEGNQVSSWARIADVAPYVAPSTTVVTKDGVTTITTAALTEEQIQEVLDALSKKVQTYKVVGNTTSHNFKIGTIVTKVNPEYESKLYVDNSGDEWYCHAEDVEPI